MNFLGFPRVDGTYGVRNLVAVLSAVDATNPLARQVADQVRGCVALCAAYGRGQIGHDEQVRRRCLVGVAGNPNVYGVLIIGLESTATKRIADDLATNGRPLHILTIEHDGSPLTVCRQGVLWALEMAKAASRQQRTLISARELIVGLECGGSDSTSGLISNPVVGLVADQLVAHGATVLLSEPSEWVGAEDVLRRRAANATVAQRVVTVAGRYEDYARSQNVDFLGANPAPENIRGGISTIEEKALGSIRKGGTSPIQAVVGYGERPGVHGLVLMDGPAPALENITGMAAAGAQAVLFTTGKGNAIGHPVLPVIAVTANRATAAMSELIDVNLAPALDDPECVTDLATALYHELLQVCSGTVTCTEALAYGDFVIGRFGQSI